MGETHSDESHNLNLTPSIALQDTIIRIHSELVDISRDIFKMHFSTRFTRPKTEFSTRCLLLPKFCTAINETISPPIQFEKVLLLESTENVLNKSTIVPIVIVTKDYPRVISFNTTEPYGIFIYYIGQPQFASVNRLSSSDFRTLTSSLYEDAVTIREQTRFELIESQSLIDEMQSRSLAEIPIQITEGGKLLNGRYTNLKRIGEGHNGIVWKAKEPKMGRDVAIKMLRPRVSDINGMDSFLAEVFNHGKLIAHQNIVQIYTIHDVARPPFYVMEFVEGNSLADVLQDDPTSKTWPTYDQSIQILLDILRGLSHAHNKGVLHGDIKPANIMINIDGVAKLSDFGCAKILRLDPESAMSDIAYTSLLASETYSAPEILKGEKIETDDFSSDIFSFGLVMYLLLSKTHPFLSSTGLVQIKELIKNDDYHAPSLRKYNQKISDEVVEIVSLLLEKDPQKRRYKNANMLLKDLSRINEQELFTDKSVISTDVQINGQRKVIVSDQQFKGQTINIGLTAPSTSALETTIPLVQIIESDINEYVKNIGKNVVFKFLVEDNQGKAVIALEKTQSYKAMGIDLIIGHGWSAQCQAALSYVNENDMLLISPSSTSPLLSIPNDRLFRTCPTDLNQAPILAQMWKTWGTEAVLFFYRADAWGDGLYNIMTNELADRGIEEIGKIRYAGESTEFSSYLANAEILVQEAIAEHGADRVGMQLFVFSEGRTMQTQAADYPGLMSIIWMDTESGGRSIRMLNEAEDLAVQTRHFSPMPSVVYDSKYEDFLKKYQIITDTLPNFYTAAQYDACWLLVKAILETGSTNAKSISEALIPLSRTHQGLTGLLSLDENGDREPQIYNIWGYYEDPQTKEYYFRIFGNYNGIDNRVLWDYQSLKKYAQVTPPSYG